MLTQIQSLKANLTDIKTTKSMQPIQELINYKTSHKLMPSDKLNLYGNSKCALKAHLCCKPKYVCPDTALHINITWRYIRTQTFYMLCMHTYKNNF